MASNQDLYRNFTDEKFVFYVAHDIFIRHFWNDQLFNVILQGQKNILKTLWQRHLQSPEPNFSSFLRLNNLLDDTETLPLQFNEFKEPISWHLLKLTNKIEEYFPDFSSESSEFMLTRESWQCNFHPHTSVSLDFLHWLNFLVILNYFF